MPFQDDTHLIHWNLHLKSEPREVYHPRSTDEGWAHSWAEPATERDGTLHFVFPNQAAWRGRILENEPPHRFKVEYHGGSVTTFDRCLDGAGGTDLRLTDQGVPTENIR